MQSYSFKYLCHTPVPREEFLAAVTHIKQNAKDSSSDDGRISLMFTGQSAQGSRQEYYLGYYPQGDGVFPDDQITLSVEEHPFEENVRQSTEELLRYAFLLAEKIKFNLALADSDLRLEQLSGAYDRQNPLFGFAWANLYSLSHANNFKEKLEALPFVEVRKYPFGWFCLTSANPTQPPSQQFIAKARELLPNSLIPKF